MTVTELIFVCALLMLSWVFPGEGFDVKEDEGPVSQRDPQDRLSRMWEQQVDFMKLLQQERNFPEFPTDLSSKKGQKFLDDIRHHCQDELHEAAQHLKNSKSHRATEIPEIDREAFLEELVDALHLYFELVIASGISLEELVEAYLQKGRVNVDRIKNGY